MLAGIKEPDPGQISEARDKAKERERRKAYIANNPNGTFTTYYPRVWLFKKVRTVESYKDGTIRKIEHYHQDGKLTRIAYYDGDNDHKHNKMSKFEIFNEDGEHETTIEYSWGDNRFSKIETTYDKNGNLLEESELDGGGVIHKGFHANGNISFERISVAGDDWDLNYLSYPMHTIKDSGNDLIYREFYSSGELKKLEIYKDASTFDWDQWTRYETDVFVPEDISPGWEESRPSGLWWTCEEFYKNGNTKKISSYCTINPVNYGTCDFYYNKGKENIIPIGTWRWFDNDGVVKEEDFVAECECKNETPPEKLHCYYLPSKTTIAQSYIEDIREKKSYFVNEEYDDKIPF